MVSSPSCWGLESQEATESHPFCHGFPARMPWATRSALRWHWGKSCNVHEVRLSTDFYGFLEKKQRRARFSLKPNFEYVWYLWVCVEIWRSPNVFGGGATDAALVKALDVWSWRIKGDACSTNQEERWIQKTCTHSCSIGGTMWFQWVNGGPCPSLGDIAIAAFWSVHWYAWLGGIEVQQQEREALKLLSLSKWKARQAAVSIAVLPRGLSSNFKWVCLKMVYIPNEIAI